jgi:hypothetical protein
VKAFQLNFEKGFVLHYPDALGDRKGLIFTFFKHGFGGNAWRLFSDLDGEDWGERDHRMAAPPELHIPSGVIGYVWYAHDLKAALGFALEPEPEGFIGYVERTADGWMVQSRYGQLLCCLLAGGFPEKWGWIGQIGDET